jgi:hypothetical protein
MEQILHIPQRQRASTVHHHRKANDLEARLEMPKNAGFDHAARLAAIPSGGNLIFI